MTKIVSRSSGPNISANTFAAKPKTVYLTGTKYARVEQERDEVSDVQTLIVTNEPDTWIINLVNKTGRHAVDEGPTFEVHLPVFWTVDGRPDRDFGDLEFGRELTFFSKERSRTLPAAKIEGHEYEVRSLKTGGREVILFLDAKTGHPFQIDLVNDGRPEGSVRYLSYETNLPFDPKLFAPPAGVEITEPK